MVYYHYGLCFLFGKCEIKLGCVVRVANLDHDSLGLEMFVG